MFRLAQLARAQALEGHQDDVLGQVVRGRRVAEVAQAVQASPGREPPVQLRFGLTVPAGDSVRQSGVARFRDVVSVSQGTNSIRPAHLSKGSVTGSRFVTPPRARKGSVTGSRVVTPPSEEEAR